MNGPDDASRQTGTTASPVIPAGGGAAQRGGARKEALTVRSRQYERVPCLAADRHEEGTVRNRTVPQGPVRSDLEHVDVAVWCAAAHVAVDFVVIVYLEPHVARNPSVRAHVIPGHVLHLEPVGVEPVAA
jgi:hypothetical protein